MPENFFLSLSFSLFHLVLLNFFVSFFCFLYIFCVFIFHDGTEMFVGGCGGSDRGDALPLPFARLPALHICCFVTEGRVVIPGRAERGNLCRSF